MTLASILLVDDDIAFARSMAKRLAQHDLKVFIAAGKSEAIEVMNRHEEIEVIILDDSLPELKNFELLRQMRALFPLTEVIMLTGHTTFETAIEGLCFGAFEYLMKLCDMDYFVEQIMAAVRQKRQQEEKIFFARLKALSSAWVPADIQLNEGFSMQYV